MSLSIRPARPDKAGLVLGFIKELAEYEKLLHEAAETKATLLPSGENTGSVFCRSPSVPGGARGNDTHFTGRVVGSSHDIPRFHQSCLGSEAIPSGTALPQQRFAICRIDAGVYLFPPADIVL